MTIQRGIDPRGLALLSFGGSGPAQSPAVMELLGMKAGIVPLNPGNLSAFGLLAVDWRTDHIATRVTHEDALDPAALAGIYRQLEREASETLARDGIDPRNVRLVREADVRVGQSMECACRRPAAKSITPSSRGWWTRSTPRTRKPSATAIAASRRSSW
jgi:N-methylhydantoinase A